MDYQKLIDVVDDAGHELFWLGAASEAQVVELESLLGFELPVSFKYFLTTYGGGGVVGSEISGIEDNIASLDNGGTVYGDTLTVREDYGLPAGLAVIFFKDDEICWCLDSSKSNEDGEYSVVSYDLFKRNVSNIISKDFAAFFTEYLELRTNN